MDLATRSRTRLALAMLGVLVLAAGVDGARAWQAHRWNAAIAAGTLPQQADAAASWPAEARFAQACALAADGADQEALGRLRALQDDSPLGQAARYNSANLLMRQAVEVRGGPQPGQAIPLIELAKETYREVLRVDPGHWDARYNLERAQRLLADPDLSDEPPAQPPENAERAATTMRGVSPGLP